MNHLLRRTGWVIEWREVTAIPLAIIFPFLRHAALLWVFHLFGWATRRLRRLMGYQGLLVCHNPNRLDMP